MQFWKSIVVDALTVHLQSESNVIVALPVAGREIASAAAASSTHTTALHTDATDVISACRLLASKVSDVLKESGLWQVLETKSDCRLTK